MCTYLRTKTQDIAQNLVDNFFSNFDSKKKKWKKYGGTELFFEKTGAMHAELNKRAQAAPVVILQKLISDIIFIRCLWLRIIRSSDQGA